MLARVLKAIYVSKKVLFRQTSLIFFVFFGNSSVVVKGTSYKLVLLQIRKTMQIYLCFTLSVDFLKMASQDVIKDPLLVVAIDFGTTFSGYAFQFKHEYSKEDPTNKISAPQAWNDGKMQVASMKTPTCLLLKNDGEIESFGYEVGISCI
jgi:hypothetical protein